MKVVLLGTGTSNAEPDRPARHDETTDERETVLREYAEALALYRKCDFKHAELLYTGAGDPTSLIILERCRIFLRNTLITWKNEMEYATSHLKLPPDMLDRRSQYVIKFSGYHRTQGRKERAGTHTCSILPG